MTARRSKSSVETPFLFPREATWKTHGIFSEHFIQTRLQQAESWPKDEEAVRAAHATIQDLWHRRHIGFEKGNEETTRREFIEPALKELGFAFQSNLDLPLSASRQTPDYLLFADEQIKDQVFNVDDTAKYEAAISLLEAKKVGHPLDAVSKKEIRFPHQQIRDYLSNVTDKAGRPYFRWAILTNGNHWRLYCRDAHPSAYFQFHLAGPGASFCSLQDFKVFFAVFSSKPFVESAGLCLLDEIRDGALQFQAELEESIRRRVFVVIQDLANGFWSFAENKLTEQHLGELYDNCLILLYRLLFVLYAEGRGLLPVKLSGAGSNANYRERYSLQRLHRKLQSPAEFRTDDFSDLYEDLRRLFRLINGDRPSANKACAVPRYNGRLFDHQTHSQLEEWRIGDKSLAGVLRDLIFSSGPSQRAKQKEFEWGTIDYADLEVRQLGDIYEGLLGGHLEIDPDSNELNVMGERAALQESGTFYTPDWVVRFLVEKTLQPLINQIDKSEPVQKAKTLERKDNSFATQVLNLNLLDPAMGSGHFLVRATERLADEIVYHPTTEFQIRSVSPGLSQEQAEISYWRRRVVESCIYGVDLNPLAVELSKLSLWLTCIASDEPLNFLDHHLRTGNSLIGANVLELASLPSERAARGEEVKQTTLSLGTEFSNIVAAAIREIAAIERESSVSLEVVKDKERRWNERIMAKLEPFKQVANLWVAAVAGLPLTQFDYCQLGALFLANHTASPKLRRELANAMKPFAPQFKEIVKNVKPFHWELEFPDVFREADGRPLVNGGFDAILGNPPYISTQTSSEFSYRQALEQRFGFTDDLYVHFVEQGFKLLRKCGTFGFIISDTFFTLSTKLRLREILQTEGLEFLVQCDPFRATVDAAMFVASKAATPKEFTFIQARYSTKSSQPEKEVPNLLTGEPSLKQGDTEFECASAKFPVFRGEKGCLRIYRTSVEPYRRALKQAFFEPTEAIVRLYNRFIDPMNRLVDQWWDKIETSKKFAANRPEILAYHKTLKPGDITLVGLIAEGGQGMVTANNGRFLGYHDGTAQAKAIRKRQTQLAAEWNKNPRVGPAFKELFDECSGDFESVVEPLKERFGWRKELGLQKGEIYRIVPPNLVAESEDFVKAFEFRKVELETLWGSSREVADYYEELRKRHAGDFIKILDSLLNEASRGSFALAELGLRSGETYSDPDDAPRIAAVYSGFVGKRTWVPYRKGDPEGNKWKTDAPLFINWSKINAHWLWNHSGRPESNMPVIRNAHLYFTSGISWTRHANHVALKAGIQPPCVFDTNGSRMTPIGSLLTVNQLLALLNTDLFSFIVKKFVKNTQDYEVNDLRMAPIVVPNRSQAKELESLANCAIQAKDLSLKNVEPVAELVTYCRSLAESQKAAPPYLQPHPQMLLLHTPADCLAIIELAVNWAVERLYGVEGLGPFNDF